MRKERRGGEHVYHGSNHMQRHGSNQVNRHGSKPPAWCRPAGLMPNGSTATPPPCQVYRTKCPKINRRTRPSTKAEAHEAGKPTRIAQTPLQAGYASMAASVPCCTHIYILRMPFWSNIIYYFVQDPPRFKNNAPCLEFEVHAAHFFQQTFSTFLSDEHVAILLPSGLNRTQFTKFVCWSLFEWSILNGGPW